MHFCKMRAFVRNPSNVVLIGCGFAFYVLALARIYLLIFSFGNR